MNYWKITNKCASKVRLAVTIGPAQSVGAILQPGDSIICNPQRTPSMDAQIRRNFVTLETDFNNESYGFKLGQVYSEDQMNQKKLEVAAQNANQYVDKK